MSLFGFSTTFFVRTALLLKHISSIDVYLRWEICAFAWALSCDYAIDRRGG